MNNRFTELIRTLGYAGYEVLSIASEKAAINNSLTDIVRGGDVGDIVLRISPAAMPKPETGESGNNSIAPVKAAEQALSSVEKFIKIINSNGGKPESPPGGYGGGI
jgi:hypothetical protein